MISWFGMPKRYPMIACEYAASIDSSERQGSASSGCRKSPGEGESWVWWSEASGSVCCRLSVSATTSTSGPFLLAAVLPREEFLPGPLPASRLAGEGLQSGAPRQAAGSSRLRRGRWVGSPAQCPWAAFECGGRDTGRYRCSIKAELRLPNSDETNHSPDPNNSWAKSRIRVNLDE